MNVRRVSLKILGLVLMTGLALAATAAPASAATATRVNALNCALAGGQATIPAGTEVEVGLGTIWGNRGLTTDFLHSQRTSVSINGGAAIDTSDAWSQPEPINLAPFGDAWITRHTYDTGVVLGQGDSMHFQMVLDEPHLLLDLLVFVNGDSGQPVLFQPAVYTYDCTVTGV